MIHIAICDDDFKITEQMLVIVKQYQTEKNVELQCDIYHNGESLLISFIEYDIIFLDIYMKGMNGIETAKKIRKKDKTVEIIYLSSYGGLTKEALSVHAFEYLEKPIKKADIYFQLDEVLERIKQNKANEENKYHIMEFNAGRSKIRFPLDDIIYFERVDRKIKVVTRKGKFILYDTIASLENRLRPYDFVLPHQSFIININLIKDYINNEILMINDDIIPLAQKRASDFKQIMREFLQKKLEDK